MSDIMSRNKLKKSYEKILSEISEDIEPLFDENEYRGKHLEGKWIKYPFKCIKCRSDFERNLSRTSKMTCPYCTEHKRPGRQTSWEQIISQFKKIHGSKYSYPDKPKDYRGQRTVIEIECKVHGKYQQKISKHLEGYGCKSCSDENRRVGKKEFIRRSSVIHDNNYDYSDVNYVNQYEKVLIKCPTHGGFWQAPGHHMYIGANCPKCTVRVSRGHSEISDFIRSFGYDVIDNERAIIAPFELDIYIPKLSLAIEYNGLRWHSEAFNSQQNYHSKKHDLCEEKGIRLITIFEDEWQYKGDIVRASLKHFLGKSDKGYFARKVEIKEVDWKTSTSFLDEHHLLGSSTSKYRIGAFYGDELIAVMTFGSPSDERGSVNTIEMKRFVTDKRNHPGLGSKMFKWAIEKYEFSNVIAFVDRRWFKGSFKFISGFEEVGRTRPTLYWTDFKNRYKRRFITKKDLLSTDEFKNSKMTKKEMMNRLGYYRIWDCGKIKMEWRKNR